MSFFSSLSEMIGISGKDSESGPKEDVKKETTVGETSGEFAEFSAFDLILTNQFADFNIDYLNPTPTQTIVPIAIRKMDAIAPPLSIYSWNLESNVWTKLLDAAGSCHSAVVIHPEKVVILGGIRDNACLDTVTTFILKQSALETQLDVPMKIARTRTAATFFKNILTVVGGWAKHKYLTSMEIYDDKNRVWYACAEMNKPRANAQLIAFEDTLYVFGGYSGREYEAEFERYDEAANKWIVEGKMAEPTAGFAACAFDEYIVLAGGWNNGNNTLNTIWAYAPKRKLWCKPFGSLEKPRKSFSMIVTEINGEETMCAIGG
ncbi:hypothetical protein WR25_08088 isoform C [Diploscapter pachys]|nr:hypothetical protein WR25_08088 isoform C [Diploscapter pachys]